MARFPLFALDHLCCPLCQSPLRHELACLRCVFGHCFDIARSGYVNLLAQRAPTHLGDSREMVAARSRFLLAGHYAPLTATIEQLAASTTPLRVLDVGSGPGHYVAHVLDRCAAHAIAVDASRAAAHVAARAHGRIAAVVARASALPLRGGQFDLALSVFAPRDAREIRRVLADDGAWLVVSPGPPHLHELVAALGLLRVDPHKHARMEARLGPLFRCEHTRTIEIDLRLTRQEARDLVAMGPSAWHVRDWEIVARLSRLEEPVHATAAFVIRILRPRC
jgi:23S rRNA (guanine745-N1)-methyltransferase